MVVAQYCGYAQCYWIIYISKWLVVNFMLRDSYINKNVQESIRRYSSILLTPQHILLQVLAAYVDWAVLTKPGPGPGYGKGEGEGLRHVLRARIDRAL